MYWSETIQIHETLLALQVLLVQVFLQFMDYVAITYLLKTQIYADIHHIFNTGLTRKTWVTISVSN